MILHKSPLALGLIAATALWGVSLVLVQEAIAGYSALAFLALRFALASAAMLPFTLRRVGRREVLAGVPAGAVLAVSMLLLTVGLHGTTTTNSGLMAGLYVVAAPVLARLLFGVRVGRRGWLAVGLSLVGLALVARGEADELRPGDVLTLAAAVLFGLHIALLSRLSPGSDAGGLTLVQLLAPVALFGPVAYLSDAALLPPSVSAWAAVALTGLGATAFGFWVQTRAQARMSAARTAVILSAEPVFAGAAGYIFAGDRLSQTQLAGAGLMLLAAFVAELWPHARRAARGRARAASLPTSVPPLRGRRAEG